MLPSLPDDIANLTRGLFAFYVVRSTLRRVLSRKQANNIVSGTHALASLAFSGRGDLANLRWFSTAYFLNDTLSLAEEGKYSVVNAGYVYHHLAAIYLLRGDATVVPIHTLMFWGELSNLASYPLYYYLHKQGAPQREKIRFLRKVQRYLYCGIRIPVFSWQLFWFLRTSPAWQHVAALVPVYLMGVVWAVKILAQGGN